MARLLAHFAPASTPQRPIDRYVGAAAIVDRSIRYLQINAAWKAAMGIGDEAIGRTPMELFGAPFGFTRAEFEAALGGHESVKTFKTPNHERLGHVTISPWRDISGRTAGVMIRHSIERSPQLSLEGRERRMRMALDMAKVLFLEVDFRGHQASFDPPHPLGVVVPSTRSFEDVVNWLPEPAREPILDAWRAHLETREAVAVEVPLATPDGGSSWHRLVLEAIRGVDGQVVGFIAIAQIIDEIKAAERALIAGKEAAEAADRAKGDFLANISHEVRTPLTAIIGFADVLQQTEGLPAAARPHVRRISAAGQLLLTLVNDLLDFARLEVRLIPLNPTVFDPAECVRTAVSLFEARAAECGLGLTCDLAPDLPAAVEADSARLRQVLAHLIGNAIKFTDAGDVSISAGYEHRAGRLRITVSDTGPGIAADLRDRLFQRFTQADESISRRHGGAGLGLVICKRLVELMGGEIGVESEAGSGSTFWFVVPASGATPVAEVAGGGEALYVLPAHILVVDDVAANRELVRAMLTPLGHNVEEAADGAEAVRAAQRSRFDLILMDLQMPGMDGFTATRAIRATAEANKDTPILAFSASVLSESTDAAIEAGMVDYIGKPIQPMELLTKVAMWTSSPLAEDSGDKVSATS